MIEEQGEAPEVIEYIKTPLDNASITELLTMLDMNARDLMRKQEDTYKELKLDNPDLSEAQLVQALADYPRLLERPIVVRNGKAVVARPPEKVLELFA